MADDIKDRVAQKISRVLNEKTFYFNVEYAEDTRKGKKHRKIKVDGPDKGEAVRKLYQKARLNGMIVSTSGMEPRHIVSPTNEENENTDFLDAILKDKEVRSRLMTVDIRDRARIQEEIMKPDGRFKFLSGQLSYRRIT